MKRNIISLCLCALVGPCVVIQPSRNYHVTGENAIVYVTVEKQESIDAKVEGAITGINATATASANISTDGAKKAIKDEVKK